MKKSTSLRAVLEPLQSKARADALTDSEWAARAGIRKETLSRLRRRSSCDFATLDALARAVGSRIGVIEAKPEDGAWDTRFPTHFERSYEEKLIGLCASRDTSVTAWLRMGPAFFMAGIGIMLASVPEFDRRAMLDLAERLYPGSSQTAVFALWLERSPLRPSRFLPMLITSMRRVA